MRLSRLIPTASRVPESDREPKIKSRRGRSPDLRHRLVLRPFWGHTPDPRCQVGCSGSRERPFRLARKMPARLSASPTNSRGAVGRPNSQTSRTNADRKNVVEGKSLSVAVEYGGRI